MLLHGIIQSAELIEVDPATERIEMILKVQGVGPTQPRKIVIPYELLLQDDALDPDLIRGHAFEADVEQDVGSRWVVNRIAFAGRILKTNDPT